MLEREVAILYRKELRQLLATKAAIATSALLPVMMLGVMPMVFLVAARSSKTEPVPQSMNFGMLAELGKDPRKLPLTLLPLMVAMVGLILPTANAGFSLIVERERRTLELLVALPVRIEQVLKAKLMAVVTMALGGTLPLLAVDMVAYLLAGIARPVDVIALPILLACVLAYSTGSALLTAVLAKDFRTANNVGGAMLVPAIFVTMAISVALPGGIVRPLMLSLAYLTAAAVLTRIALRMVTFERLLD